MAKTRNQVSIALDEVHEHSLLIDEREIFLHGEKGSEDDPGVNYEMASTFLKNIRFLQTRNNKPIIVHQHSIGGYWDSGMLIFDAIKTCEAPVIIICHGIAASMGSVVPQAADLRVMMPSCYFMIHQGYTGISQEFTMTQRTSWYDWETKINKDMINLFTGVMKKSTLYKDKTGQQVKNILMKHLQNKEDWWLDAHETVSSGFADGVFGEKGYEDIKSVLEHV
jgi:ATP-dependent protease ClpP protease subunit